MPAIRENSRKLVHIFSLVFALLLPFLTPSWAFLLAFAAFVHNILLLPKYAPEIFRNRENLMQGIAAYPLMVAVLVLMFPHQLQFAGGAWAILSWGDGFSSLSGRVWRVANIPWNPEKSLGGMMMFIIMGTFAAVIIMAWIGPVPTYQHLIFTAFIATTCAAIYETLPLPWDDNIIVSLISVVFISIAWNTDIELSDASISISWLCIALLVNAVIAFFAWFAGSISTSGSIAGIIIGTLILVMGGISLYLLLIIFFVLATIATRLGFEEKDTLGLAQGNKGKRGSKHALANGGLAVLAVVLYGMCDGVDIHMLIFYCAALATALSDTVSSELGQLYGKQPFLPTTFRRVPPGTVGAISIEGTLFGIAATVIFAFIAWLVSAISLALIPAIIVGACVGFYIESYIGGVWTERGMEVNNEWMNVLNTFTGGSIALIIAHMTNAL